MYSPATGHIGLPPDHAFKGPDQYAATAFFEIAHYTGHSSPLNRDLKNRFGSSAYAMEGFLTSSLSAPKPSMVSRALPHTGVVMSEGMRLKSKTLKAGSRDLRFFRLILQWEKTHRQLPF
ncbi:MAG TPA: zincin-like metallopeptidase domain-containing protein [Terracidiphilus sp.]